MASLDTDVVPADIEFDSLVWDLTFHPHHDVLAVGMIDGTIKVYEYKVDETNLVYNLGYHKNGVRAMGFSMDGQFLYSVSSDNTLKALDCNAKQIVFDTRNTGHPEELNAMVVCDENIFATGDDGGIVRIWDRRQMAAVITYEDLEGSGVNSFVYNPAKTTLLCGTDDGTIGVLNFKNTKEAEDMTDKTEDSVLSMALLKEGKILAAGCASGNVRMWKNGKWDCMADNLQGHPAEVEGMVALREGDIATACCDGCVRVVQLHPQPKLIDTLGSLEDAPFVRLRKSRCGHLVAAGGGGAVQFFDVRSHKLGVVAPPAGGTQFLKEDTTEGKLREDDDDDDDDDEEDEEDEEMDDDDDGKDAMEEDEKKHRKGSHRLDFNQQDKKIKQKQFFSGL